MPYSRAKSFPFISLKILLIYFEERERECKWGEGQKEREREYLKLASCGLTLGRISPPQDCDLSLNQESEA